MVELVRVIVADNHPLFRDGVIAALRTIDDVTAVDEASTASEALKLARERPADLVLIDVALPGGGLQVAREIAACCPETRVVMLSSAVAEDDLLSAMRVGVSGYVHKTIGARELVTMLRRVLSDEVYVTPTFAGRVLRKMSRLDATDPVASLTPRERDVLRLLTAGHTNHEIAASLGLSEKTIKYYVTRVLGKLQVRSRTEAALLAVRLGLIKQDEPR